MENLRFLTINLLFFLIFLSLPILANNTQQKEKVALLATELQAVSDLRQNPTKKDLDEFLERFTLELENSNVEINVLSRLIKHESYLNAQTPRVKNSLLHLVVKKLFFATSNKKAKTIDRIKKFQLISRWLLEKGTDPNLLNSQNETALHTAIHDYWEKEHMIDHKIFPVYSEFIQILIGYPGVSRMNFPRLQENPLIPSFMNLLVRKNIQKLSNSKNKFIRMAKESYVFLDNKRMQILKMMLEEGFNINEAYKKEGNFQLVEENYLTNLFSYERSLTSKTIRAITDAFNKKSALPNIINHQGESLLHIHADIKKTYLLLKHGANPNQRDQNGETPLFRKSKDVMLEFGEWAFVERNHFLIRLKMLFENSANPNILNHKNETFLDQIINYYKQSEKEEFRKDFLLKILSISFFHNAKPGINENQIWAEKFLEAHRDDFKIKIDEYKFNYNSEAPSLHPYRLFEQLENINNESLSFFIFSSEHLDSRESLHSKLSYCEFFLQHTPLSFINPRLIERLLKQIVSLHEMGQVNRRKMLIERVGKILADHSGIFKLPHDFIQSHPYLVKKIRIQMSIRGRSLFGFGYLTKGKIQKSIRKGVFKNPFSRFYKK